MAKNGPRATPRTKANVPGGKAAGKGPPRAGDNSKNLTPDEERALFLSVRGKWQAAQNAVKVAEAKVDDVVAEARSAGFTKKMLQIADDLVTTRGESKIKGEIGDRLKVARMIGHPMGQQYDLFEKGVAAKVATVDRAYDEGKQASMENRPAKPNDAPGTPGYEAYMRGFHDHQQTIAGGIKPLDQQAPHGNA